MVNLIISSKSKALEGPYGKMAKFMKVFIFWVKCKAMAGFSMKMEKLISGSLKKI
jgi:hypothetical protein